jgi:5-(carboxyamino)imidazole ribonucleotide mutase
MVSVSVIIGSESDKELGEAAIEMLKAFGVDSELKVLSAHRNPKQLAEYVEKSEVKVFITIAGLAAALPGVVASHTVKPVIGVPKEVKLGGIDALLSIVQMPTGIPVATVGIDNAKNAGLLAVEILALSEISLNNKLVDYRRKRASSG